MTPLLTHPPSVATNATSPPGSGLPLKRTCPATFACSPDCWPPLQPRVNNRHNDKQPQSKMRTPCEDERLGGSLSPIHRRVTHAPDVQRPMSLLHTSSQ